MLGNRKYMIFIFENKTKKKEKPKNSLVGAFDMAYCLNRGL